MIYLLLKLKFISESGNGIGPELQCQMNYGAQWNEELSIPIQTPFKDE